MVVADLVSFTSMRLSSHPINLNAIQNVVGRFQLRNGPSRRWAIIDRSSNWARTVFVDDNVNNDAQYLIYIFIGTWWTS